MLFQYGQAVGRRSQTGTLDISRVVARTAIVIVFASLDTIVDKQGKECCRRILREHTVDVVAYPHLLVDNEVELLQISVIQFIVGLERAGIAGFNTHFRSAYRIDTII